MNVKTISPAPYPIIHNPGSNISTPLVGREDREKRNISYFIRKNGGNALVVVVFFQTDKKVTHKDKLIDY